MTRWSNATNAAAAHAIASAVGSSGQRGTIKIRSLRDGDAVVISIGDTGTGIPPEVREWVFEPFFTTRAHVQRKPNESAGIDDVAPARPACDQARVRGSATRRIVPAMFVDPCPHSADRRARWLVLWALGMAVSGGCSKPSFSRLPDARATVEQLGALFTKASDASNRAVMADTDAQSQTYADEAVATVREVDRTTASLRPILLGYTEELGHLDEFVAAFDRYRALDKEILALAVENTNLKAQRLSFGTVREAADAMVDALDHAAQSVPAAQSARFAAAAAAATIAVRQIQVLEAPHIAEPRDDSMAALEAQMASHERAARAAIASLSSPDQPPATAAALGHASQALDRFLAQNAEVVRLSRKNTNVRSLALVLGPKPALIAACDGALQRLAAALAKRTSGGTR
jgi:hypothetical protein